MSKKLLQHLSRHKIPYLIGLIVLIVALVSVKSQTPDFNSVENQVSGDVSRVSGNELTFTSTPQPTLNQGDSYRVNWTNGQRVTSVYLVPEDQKAKPILLTKSTNSAASVTIDHKIKPGNYSLGIKSGTDLAKSPKFKITPKNPTPKPGGTKVKVPINGDQGSKDVLAPTPEPTPACGNGILDGNEACDDGNLVNGDGCTSICSMDLPVENITLSAYIDTVQDLKIDKDSPIDSYDEPDAADLEKVYTAMSHLLKGDLREAQDKFNDFGYELKYLTNNGHPLIVFEETTKDNQGNYEKGWGGGVLPVSQLQGVPIVTHNKKDNVVVWTPHTIFELRLSKVGRGVFEVLRENEDFNLSHNTVFLFNTAYRYNHSKTASQGGGYKISDFSRHDKTPGASLHKALLDHVHEQGGKTITLDLHGYSNENYPNWQAMNVVPKIIVGDSENDNLKEDLANGLKDNFEGVKVCGLDWDELCGDTDELNKLESGNDITLHPEIDTTLRDTDAEATSIAETIAEKLAMSLTD